MSDSRAGSAATDPGGPGGVVAVSMALEVIEIRPGSEVDGDGHGSYASGFFPAGGGRAV